MNEIVQQIGALLLSAIPTIVLFVVLVAAYQFLVQGPLTKMLAERRARTAGAV
jgi:F-type H+-transporting ATPase subunit b